MKTSRFLAAAGFALAITLTQSCSSDDSGASHNAGGGSSDSNAKSQCIETMLQNDSQSPNGIMEACGATRSEVFAYLPPNIGTCVAADIDTRKTLGEIAQECGVQEIPIVPGTSSSSGKGSSSSVAVTCDNCRECDYSHSDEWCIMPGGGTIVGRCSGQTTTSANFYNPITQGCCGSARYSLQEQKCGTSPLLGHTGVLDKCGSGWYFSHSSNRDGGQMLPYEEEACCNNTAAYIVGKQRCENGIVETRCGTNSYYNPATHFCSQQGSNYTVVEKCGTAKKEYDPQTQRCESGVVETKCGSTYYNSETHKCENNVVKMPCGTQNWYDPNSQTCENGTVADKLYCGYNGFKVCISTNNENCDNFYGDISIGTGDTNDCNALGLTMVDSKDDPQLEIFCARIVKECAPGYNGCYYTYDVSYCAPIAPADRPADMVADEACKYRESSSTGTVKTRAQCSKFDSGVTAVVSR